MELPLRVRPAPLVIIALLILLLSSSIGTGQAWFDPIAPLLFLLGISLSFSPLIYGALLMSLFVDLLYAEPLGTTAIYYLLITYLSYRSNKHINVKKPVGIFIVALIVFAISYGAWYGVMKTMAPGLLFPYVPLSLIISALPIPFLWKR